MHRRAASRFKDIWHADRSRLNHCCSIKHQQINSKSLMLTFQDYSPTYAWDLPSAVYSVCWPADIQKWISGNILKICILLYKVIAVFFNLITLLSCILLCIHNGTNYYRLYVCMLRHIYTVCVWKSENRQSGGDEIWESAWSVKAWHNSSKLFFVTSSWWCPNHTVKRFQAT